LEFLRPEQGYTKIYEKNQGDNAAEPEEERHDNTIHITALKVFSPNVQEGYQTGN